MNILIVEDEEYSRAAIESMALSHENVIHVDSCSFSKDALILANQQKYDVALLDIDLPDMTGLELAEHLNSLQPSIHIVFITAFNHFAAEAFEVYAIDYLLKPLRKEKLHGSLSRIQERISLNRITQQSLTKTCHIKCLGKFEVWIDEQLVTWKRTKAREIFAYLFSQKNSPIHKEKLCDNIFEDLPLSKALLHLQSAISQLRRLGFDIRYSGSDYHLVIPRYTSDLDELSKLIEAYHFQKENKSLLVRQIETLYRGDLFEEDGWLWSYELAGDYRRAFESVTGCKQ